MIGNLLNHPDIRPAMGGDGWLDAELLPPHIYLGDERGGMLFIENATGIYEVHYLFTAEIRGGEALKIASGMILALMLDHDAKMIWGSVPIGNRPARIFTRKLGFTSLGIRERLDKSFEDFVLRREWVSWATPLAALPEVSSTG